MASRPKVDARYKSSKASPSSSKAFEEDGEAFDDLYLASTFGLDAMVGYEAGIVTPYASLGFTDVSTFFYIGDDAVVTNNLHPYAGLASPA